MDKHAKISRSQMNMVLELAIHKLSTINNIVWVHVIMILN